MSRNNHNPGGSSGPKNPALKFYEWKEDKANPDTYHWSYYNKENDERKSVKATDMTFIVLDEFIGVSGYSESDNGFYYSNEVRQGGELEVKVRDKVVGKGKWADVKNDLPDAKFSKVLYVLTKFGGEAEIARLRLAGSSLSPWFLLTTGMDQDKKKVAEPVNPQDNIAISVVSVGDAKKGKVTFQYPIFGTKAISKETAAESDDAFDVVQDFIKDRDGAGQPVQEAKEAQTSGSAVDENDDIPF
jgi:hypothetical protein